MSKHIMTEKKSIKLFRDDIESSFKKFSFQMI